MTDEPQMIREPAWVTSLADQRVAHIAANTNAAILSSIDVVMSPLVDAPEGADLEKWERTCDNCGAHIPLGQTFNCGMVQRQVHGRQVILSYGACPTCLPIP